MRAEKSDFDVIIVGAGPAGVSAAIWCADLGLTAVVLEKQPEPGGQLLWIHNPITNYPGLFAKNGLELRDRFMESFDRFDIPLMLSAEVAKIDTDDTSVTLADGRRITAKHIILATGVRRRKLNVPGEEEFQGKGILESGARDKHLVKGKAVAIIGGGDAALENASILAEYASRVYVIHRGGEFSARENFVRAAAENPKIQLILETVVTKINGRGRVESVELLDRKSGRSRELSVNLLLPRIGVAPNTDLLIGQAELDSKGYVKVDHFGNTSEQNVFAIGDAANPVSPTVASAAGAGATAAKAAARLIKTQ